MLLSQHMLIDMKRPYQDLAQLLSALRGDRSIAELASLAGTSDSVIHRALNGGTFPEPAALKLARSLQLSKEERTFLMELVGRARAYGNKYTRDWATSVEVRLTSVEQECLKFSRYILRFRDQLPHEVVERCEALIQFFEPRN